jgi:hypothetical protein
MRGSPSVMFLKVRNATVPKSIYFFGALLVLLSIPPLAYPFAVLILMIASLFWMAVLVPVTAVSRAFAFEPSTVNAIAGGLAIALIGGLIALLLRKYMRDGISEADERRYLNRLIVIVGSLLVVAASYWNIVR